MNWLVYLNKLLAVSSALVYAGAGMGALLHPRALSLFRHELCEKNAIPAPFTQSDSAYKAIASGPLFALHYQAPQAQLPDLRQELVLYGLDERPDADPHHPIVHLGLGSSAEVHGFPAGQVRYLIFDRSQAVYRPSPDNKPSNLWITLTAFPHAMIAEVGMMDRHGRLIYSPKEHARFEVAQSSHRPASEPWQLGAQRVDNSLLARLHTRWYGEDQFLTDHGGSEFSSVRGKQRLDFGQGDDVYSCFVEQGECLVWKGDRWINLRPGESSRGLPLLHLKNLKEKLMLFELWDEMGRTRVTLSLMRSRDVWLPRHMKDTVRFVGARTWSEFVLNVGGERLVVSPQDWLLLDEGGWHLLRKVEEIDAYVSGRLQGELLVLDGLEREGGTQTLKGHLYNTSRTSLESMDIALTPQIAAPSPSDIGLAGAPAPSQSGGHGEGVILQQPLALDSTELGDELLSLPHVVRGLTHQLRELSP